MKHFKEVDGDLIVMAKQAKFDVIAHGCNCFCTMRRGLAPKMDEAFGVYRYHDYPSEAPSEKGNINKLGGIAYKTYTVYISGVAHKFQVVNAYTQYHYNWESPDGIPLDYTALRMCMRKLNYEFAGAHIGLPKIGAGVAGGNWSKIKEIMIEEFVDCDVTIVNYKKK